MVFRGEYWFLSNMYPVPVRMRMNGRTYAFTCSEAAFQACKCPARMVEFERVDGFAAKRLGKRVPLRGDWDEKKLEIMRRILILKFGQNPELAKKLLMVRGPIVEDNSWGDTYWGRCNGTGENRLGLLLMELRDRLAAAQG